MNTISYQQSVTNIKKVLKCLPNHPSKKKIYALINFKIPSFYKYKFIIILQSVVIIYKSFLIS